MAQFGSFINLQDMRLIAMLLCVAQMSLRAVMGQVPTYYFDDYCANTLDMGIARVNSGRLLLRRPGDGIRYLNCRINIKAPANKMLTFKFHFFDIQSPQGCNNNHLQLFGDREKQLPLTERLCNTNRVPDRAYVTSGEDATIQLTKDQYLGDQIDLVFTAFTFSPCTGGEYECDNAHCIDSSLYCNGLDNCGDKSDICILRPEVVIGIIIGVVIFVVIIALILAIYLYRRQRKIRREREKEFFSDLASTRTFGINNKGYLNDSDWEKRSISDISSIYSSTLYKQPSLLSKRDHQMMVGYLGGGGSRASTLEKRPVLHPYDSELASKIHYIVHDGSSRPSTLDRKLKHAGDRKDSTLGKRSKSLDLRAPFYFDKDGYLSDTYVWQTQNDVYATPKRKRKGSKKALSKHSSSVKYANDEVKGRDNKRSKRKDKKEKKEKKIDKMTTGRGYETPPIDYETSENDISQGPIHTTDSHVKTTSGYVVNGESYQKPLIYVTPPDTATQTLVKNVAPTVETFASDDKNVVPTVETFVNEDSPADVTAEVSQLPEVSMLTTNLSVEGTKDDQQRDVGQQREVAQQRLLNSEGNGGFRRSSPIRRSAMSARHADGTPYVMHTVDPNQVTQQLKAHPEDGANPFDHVISFRSYPSPVPKQDHYVKRLSSRRSRRGK